MCGPEVISKATERSSLQREFHKKTALEVSRNLCLEMNEALGVDIDPEKMVSFLKNRWARVSVMAHKIHER